MKKEEQIFYILRDQVSRTRRWHVEIWFCHRYGVVESVWNCTWPGTNGCRLLGWESE